MSTGPRESATQKGSAESPYSNRFRVLVVEDEEKLADAIAEGLREEFLPRIARNGEEAIQLLGTSAADIVVLDIMLPGQDGFAVLRGLRRSGKRTPVLLLTARDSVEDRVAGLDAGADDYLVKPFAFAELVARIRALCRRNAPEMQRMLELADLRLDVQSAAVHRAGQKLDLTQQEFHLLHYLLVHSGRVVSREMLARDVWREADRYTPLDNVIDVQINRLRRKIDGPFERKLLHTVRGIGFILREEEA
ncbi:MAG TPA: response regulator transcription factor [Granulicella sp.]